MIDFFFHIGYPKTGTTYCQKAIFPHLQNVKFNPPELVTFINDLLETPSFLYDKEDFTSRLSQIIDLNFKEVKKIFISNESLMGAIFLGAINFEKNVKRINEVFSEPSFILTVRNQIEIINSLYIQYIHQGGYKNFTNFYQSKNVNELHFELDLFKYDLVFEFLTNKLQINQLLVLDYNLLKYNPQDFFNIISRFLDIEKIEYNNLKKKTHFNRSTHPILIPTYRKLNPLFKSARQNWSILGKLDKGRILRDIFQKYLSYLVFRFEINFQLIKDDDLVFLRKYFDKSNQNLFKINNDNFHFYKNFQE